MVVGSSPITGILKLLFVIFYSKFFKMTITRNFIKKYKIPIKFESNLHESPRWSKYNMDSKNKKVFFVNKLFFDQKNQVSNAYTLQGKISFFKQNLLTSKQLRVYFGFVKSKVFTKIKKIAQQSTGNLNTNLITLLECRLQTIMYRMNFSRTINEARQLIAHGHVLVNGIINTSSDYQTNIGDIISIKQKNKSISRIIAALHSHELLFNEFFTHSSAMPPLSTWHYKKTFSYPIHLEINYKNLIGIVVAKPNVHNMKYPTIFF